MTNPNKKSTEGLVLGQKKLAELSAEEMRAVIESLTPKSDMSQGIKFLIKLLDEKKVPGVIEFVERMHKTLDKEGRLYEYDFSDEEKKILKSCLPDLLNRRQALTNIGYGLGGATPTAYGATNLHDLATAPPSPPASRRNAFRHALKWAVPAFAEVGIGVALMNEVVKDWREMKLEHVANAVAELAQSLQASRGRA